MVKESNRYLTEEEQDYLKSRKIFKETREQRKRLETEKALEKSESKFRIPFKLGGGKKSQKFKEQPQKFRSVAPQISQEQFLLGEMFGHGDKVMFGSEEDSLPRMNGILFSGEGIIKSGDKYRETGGLFGLRW